MYLDKEWFRLIIKENYIHKTSPLECLDTYLLEKYVFKSILGLDSKTINGKIDFVSEKVNIKEIVSNIDRSESRILFLLFPIDIEEMMNVAIKATLCHLNQHGLSQNSVPVFFISDRYSIRVLKKKTFLEKRS